MEILSARLPVLRPLAVALLLAASSASPASAQVNYSFIGLGAETQWQSWSVWQDDLGYPGGGPDGDEADWGPAAAFRLSYITAGFEAAAEYESAEALFPSIGRASRSRFALNVEQRSGGEISDGVYFGLRYHSFKFENPGGNWRDHDHVELTLGYAASYNPDGPGPYFSLRVTSPTLFWLFLLSAGTRSSEEVVVNDVYIPLGLETEVSAGFRFGRVIPMEIGAGYRFYYYNTYYAESGAAYAGLPVSGVIHGAFARVQIWLGAGRTSAPDVGVWTP